MAIDTSMYGQIKQPEIQNPLNALASMAAVQQAMNTNRLADYTIAKAQREDADQDTIRSALAASGGDYKAGSAALMSKGLYKPAMEISKAALEQEEKQAAIGKNKSEAGKFDADTTAKLFDQARDLVGQVQTPEQAAAWVRGLHSHSVLGPIVEKFNPLDKALANIPTDPKALEDWKMKNALGAEKLVAYLRPDANTVSNNKQSDTNNQRTVAASKYSTDVGAATTRRGQDKVDARTKEQIAQGKLPAGYRWKADGTQEAIPGGPADLKNSAEGVKKVGEAKDVLGLLDEVDAILPNATGGYAGMAKDAIASGVGYSTEGAKTTAQLKTLQGALISKMPKMSGPQSDKDVQLYREMAGQVGDSSVPVAQRQAASTIIRKLNEKYAGLPEGASKKGAGGNSIPDGAIKMLRSNPALRAQFEAKYGAGSAASVLGQ